MMSIFVTRFCPLCCKTLKKCYQPINKKIWQQCQEICAASTSAETAQRRQKKPKIQLSEFPQERIRNFSIIAHVDHGKSTLADRLMELTGTISSTTKNEQVLDRLPVERERGITVKAQTVSLVYERGEQKYLLNLIDTPGHVDFSYEVSRSLAACQGVILLVDANQGVQAQTVANFYLAFEADLTVIPVLNKIDLKGAKLSETMTQLRTLFDIEPEEVLHISAKHGTGVDTILDVIIDRIPAPRGDSEKPLKVLLYDSWYDRFRGAVCSIAVIDGCIQKGQRLIAAHSQKSYEVQEVGIMYPNEMSTDVLYAGQVGYLYAGMKAAEDAQVGDTLYDPKTPVEPHSGFKAARPMVFAGVFPMDQSEYTGLRTALEKLTLNDSSVNVNVDSSAALGQGWRLGFLGLLHMDVFCQRLEQEYDASVIITSPNVPYKVKITGAKNIKFYHTDQLTVLNPCHLPDSSMVAEYQEPIVMATILAPDDYISEILALIRERRGEHRDQMYIDDTRVMFKAIFPLNEIIVNFFDQLKSITSGYASFDYEDYGYRESNIVKIDILMNDRIVEELTQIAHVSTARDVARRMAAKLKTSIPPQLFDIVIQAKVNAKIIARENIKATRKDVLAKCYGGDVTRKMKLLRRQAEGKRRMRKIGNIEIPKDAFVNVLKK